MSLQEKSREKVARMLRFNAAEPSQQGTKWKLLILDEQARDVVCPLYSVSGLRKQGVTLHLMLNSARECIPDVPAIYFCRPTEENIERLAEDCEKFLYTKMHLSFTTRLQRPMMEKLAHKCLQTNSVGQIHTLFDAYLDFVALEPQLFTLNQKSTFYGYNSSSGGDAAIESMMHATVNSLFTVFATLGQVPIIRAPMGGPAQMVAQLLHEALQGHLRGSSERSSLFAESGIESYARPLLVIYDRSVDASAALTHASTYQGIVADVTNYRLNRCSYVGGTCFPHWIGFNGYGDGQANGTDFDTAKADGRTKAYDLDPETDVFWRTHKGRAFPEAIDASAKVLSDVQGSTLPAGGEGSNGLNAIVDSLPELMEKKKLVENHTNIMDKCMSLISSRGIPLYMDMETDPEKHSAQDLIKFFKKEKGDLSDRVRLTAIWLCSEREISREDFDLVLEYICGSAEEEKSGSGPSSDSQSQGLDGNAARKALSWLRRFMTVGGFNNAMGGSGSETGAAEFLGSLLNRGKQMLGSVTKYKTTKLVEAAVQGGSSLGLGLAHFDPKVRGAVPVSQQQAPHEGKVIAFCIGPGSYGEYQNMVDSLGNKVTYGCSELASPDNFLQQLSQLGNEM